MKLKNILWAIVVIVLVITVFRIMHTIGAKKVQEERVYPVIVAAPRIGTVQEKVSLVGDIKGETEVVVRPKTVGRVEEIYVKEGDEVRKGQKLMSFVAGITRSDELYGDLVTFAPISGVVGMQNIKLGEQVQISNGSPSSVFTIYKINNVKIYVNVPEKYFSMVTRRTPVEIRLDAYPDKVYYGKVNNVRPVIDPYTRTTQVEIIIKNPKHEIKPGMFSKADLILREKKNVMIIPFDSVLGLEEKSVFVDMDGVASMKKVTTGIQQGDDVEVLSGIAASDEVITVGQRLLKEGDKVQISK
jgi:multidrug efflux pump subunit AcrA (membrane-fusion protein)